MIGLYIHVFGQSVKAHDHIAFEFKNIDVCVYFESWFFYCKSLHMLILCILPQHVLNHNISMIRIYCCFGFRWCLFHDLEEFRAGVRWCYRCDILHRKCCCGGHVCCGLRWNCSRLIKGRFKKLTCLILYIESLIKAFQFPDENYILSLNNWPIDSPPKMTSWRTNFVGPSIVFTCQSCLCKSLSPSPSPIIGQ